MKFRDLLEGQTPKIGDIVRAHDDDWEVIRDVTSRGHKKQFECKNVKNKELSDIYVISMK
jgi:hypothetical protein